MFKLFVLLVVVAAVAAKPGLLHAPLVAAPLAVPAAVSHTSRVDVHSSPLVVAHAAPLIAAAAPLHYAVPAATSYTSRVDLHSAPVVAAYAPAYLGRSIHPW